MKREFLISLGLALFIVGAFSVFGAKNKINPLGQSQNASCCPPEDYTGIIDYTEKTAYYEGKSIEVPDLAFNTRQQQNVLGMSQEERWVEVDISEQKLRAWEGNKLFLETLVSTGLPWYPTPQGEFRIWIKLRAAKMEGGSGKYYYYLPNVPYVMYFENNQVPGWRGYGLHGTYWHNDFGTQKSHGCVNLPTPMAEKLYYWVLPVLPEGKSAVRASNENPGTRIMIHE
jgi:lipoprotein-anchoring transpeptidase ErfK/SrfK